MFRYEAMEDRSYGPPKGTGWMVLRHDGETSPVKMNKHPLTEDEAVMLAERLTIQLIRELEER